MSVVPDPRSVTDFVSSHPVLEDAVAAGSAAAAALLAQHLAFWSEPWKLPRPAAYTLGTATLGVAFTWWAKRHNRHDAALAWWIIAAMGGGTVCTAYWLRQALREVDATARYAGRVSAPTKNHWWGGELP